MDGTLVQEGQLMCRFFYDGNTKLYGLGEGRFKATVQAEVKQMLSEDSSKVSPLHTQTLPPPAPQPHAVRIPHFASRLRI